ncbi:MAG: ComEC/Rec2 family competence protein [Phycisphaerae bacterium]
MNDDARPSAPALPAPLLSPAAAFAVGIVIAATAPAGARWLVAAAYIAPVVAGVGAVVADSALRAGLRESARVLPALLLALAAAAAGYARYTAAADLPADHVAHLTQREPVLMRLAGRVVTAPQESGPEKRNPYLPFDPPPRTRFLVEATELRNADPPVAIRGLVRVAVEGESPPIGMGDAVQLTGWLHRPIGPRNPGETDWARWSRLQHIYAGLTVESVEHVVRLDAGGSSWRRLLGRARAAVRALLIEPGGEQGGEDVNGMLDAMVLGQRSSATRAVDEAFLRTGAMHLLSVSGLHVGVLAGAGWCVSRRLLRRSRTSSAVSTILLIGLYAFVVAEPNAPILRAGVMGLLACAAVLLRRPMNGLNWLAAALLGVLAIDPFELFRAGFQLSFLLMLVLITIVPVVHRRLVRRGDKLGPPADADTLRSLVLRRAREWTLGLLAVNAVCWLVAAPLTLWHFGRIAPWGAVQSLLITPLSVLVIVLGFVAALVGLIFPPLSALAQEALRSASAGLLTVVQALAEVPGAVIETPPPPGWLTLWTYALLAAGVVALRTRAIRAAPQARWTRIPLAALIGGCVPLTAAWLAWSIGLGAGRDGEFRLAVLAVGDGSATLLLAPGGESLLYDAGTIHNFDVSRTVTAAARNMGIRAFDRALVSHANFDHYSGVAATLEKLPARRLNLHAAIVAEAADLPAVRAFLESLPRDAPPIEPLGAGERFTLGPAEFEVLWPTPEFLSGGASENDRSLVLLVRVHGARILLTGDIERAAIRSLLDRHAAGRIDLAADVLVAPHHGSVLPGDTQRFLAAVDPGLIVVSSGKPRAKFEALARETLGDRRPVLLTDEVGAIIVRVTEAGRVVTETLFAGE